MWIMPRNKAWNYWLLIEWFTIYNVRLSLSLYDHIKIKRRGEYCRYMWYLRAAPLNGGWLSRMHELSINPSKIMLLSIWWDLKFSPFLLLNARWFFFYSLSSCVLHWGVDTGEIIFNKYSCKYKLNSLSNFEIKLECLTLALPYTFLLIRSLCSSQKRMKMNYSCQEERRKNSFCRLSRLSCGLLMMKDWII